MPKKTPAPRAAPDRPKAAPTVRIGLAFGGGLPFGLVALGVLRAFDDQRIPIHRMAGTSMGSIIAAMYAAGISYDESIDRFRQAFSRKHLLPALLRDVSFSGVGVLKGAEIVQMLSSFIGDRTFEDLRIPLRIPACDLADGNEVVFETGPIVPAIRASISMPGLFEPFHYQGHQLVDGAMIRPIPVHLLRNDEVDFKIPVRAVRRRSRRQLHHDVHGAQKQHRLHSLLRSRENVFSVMWRTLSLILQDEFAEMIFDDFDVYIKPQLDLKLSRDASRIEEIADAGYAETLRILPSLRSALAETAAGLPRKRRAGKRHDPLAEDLSTEFED